MQLRFDEYAADPEVRGPARNATNDALRRVIDYFLYRDLQRGWRVTAPNLEDCGLLAFDYEALTGPEGLLADERDAGGSRRWSTPIALEICHFNPDTLEDTGARTCGKACYECLLDYGNQPDHKDLDRHLIRDSLSELSRCECRPAGGAGSRAERIAALRKRCDSQLERRWLDRVDELMLRPPSDAQYLIPSYHSRPDFFYREHNAAIYVDGPPHDEPDMIREDDGITQALMGLGYIVVRFHHGADWMEIFRRHPDIFGAPRA